MPTITTTQASYQLPDDTVDIDLYAPDIVRLTAIPGTQPNDPLMPDRRVRLGWSTAHSTIHDVHTVGWQSGNGGHMYDVTIYHIGWYSTSPDDARHKSQDGHGWTTYAQNAADSEPKVIDTCLLIAAFEGGKLLATNTDKVHHFRILHTIMAGENFLVGGQSYGADDIIFDDCAFLDCQLQLGYVAPNGEVKITACLFQLTDGTTVLVGDQNQKSLASSWQKVTFTGNVLYAGANRCIKVNHATTQSMAGWEWDHNTYYSTAPAPFLLNDKLLTFAEWQTATGFDAHSQLVTSSPPAVVRYYPIPGRRKANVAIVNPAGLGVLALPFGGGLLTSATARSAFDWQTAYDGRGGLLMNVTQAQPLNWIPQSNDPLPVYLPTIGAFQASNIVVGGEPPVTSTDTLFAAIADASMTPEQATSLISRMKDIKPYDETWDRFGLRITLIAERDMQRKALKQAAADLKATQSQLDDLED